MCVDLKHIVWCMKECFQSHSFRKISNQNPKRPHSHMSFSLNSVVRFLQKMTILNHNISMQPSSGAAALDWS